MTAERVGGLLLAAFAPLVLLAVDPWGWYPFGPSKVLVLTVVGVAGAILVLGARRPSVPRSLALALVGLVVAMAVAAVTGEEGLYAWVGTPERRFGVLTWVLCAGMLLAGRALGAGGWLTLPTGLLVAG
ncbi:MAG: hypothetical protein M3Z03_09945, partial [Actinomycetota bacterium]|nr:hypothetical protein [Actinomycetota bacterium]